MDMPIGVLVIGSLYCVLYFFDTFFKTCAHYPYIQFLRGTGLEVKLFQVRWTTTAFNRLLVRWGSTYSYSKFFTLWFTTGFYITLALLPIAVILLLIAFVQNFIKVDSVSYSPPVLKPVIPGVNLPISELGYYSVTLIVCSICHELGHALAAVKQDVNLINVGINVFLVLPVAYVNLNSDTLKVLSPWKTLHILCAGIWHNLVLSLIAYLFYCSLPYLFSSFYYIDNGVTVSHILKGSPLYGSKGLYMGDIIVKINDCNVKNDISWYSCLKEMRAHKPSFCIEADLVHTLDESIPLRHLESGGYDCCSPDKTGHFCFEYIDGNDGILELPPHVCLPARTIVEKSAQSCTNVKYCTNALHCIRPLLNNHTNLFKIKRVNKADVIYVGLVDDLMQDMQISKYVPKHVFRTSVVPDCIAKFLQYIVIFSLGLAILNVIPCFYFDGEHITASVLDILLGQIGKSKQNANMIATYISCILSCTVIANYIARSRCKIVVSYSKYFLCTTELDYIWSQYHRHPVVQIFFINTLNLKNVYRLLLYKFILSFLGFTVGYYLHIWS